MHDGGGDLGQLLVRTHSALAQAQNEAEVLQAIGESLQVFAPSYVGLSAVRVDAEGVAREIELVRGWSHGEILGDHPWYHRTFVLGDDALTRRWVEARTEPVVVEDVEGDPLLVSALRAISRTVRSLVLLPLYSKRHQRWQGLVDIHFAEHHAPSANELLVYKLLIHTVSESMASERTLQTLRGSLAESRAQQTTLRFLLDNLPLGITVTRTATGQREIVNRAAAALFGEDGETRAVAEHKDRLFRPGESAPLPFEEWPYARALRTGAPAREEIEYLRDDGTRVLVEISAQGLRYEDGELRIIGLFRDLTEIREAEKERLRAQEELLRVQAQALAERSAPLIPIRDDVLVMPLIGSIDQERGRQLLETLVHLGGRARVRAAIIDITGVKHVDTAAANALISAARALQLRGVQPIMTGIQHTTASTLVALGIDFRGISVCGTLQDGVELATAATRGAPASVRSAR